MSDEFDDLSDAIEPDRYLAIGLRDHEPARPPKPARLITRLYTAASAPLRARMLAELLSPLSPLAIVGVAAGAFACFLQRSNAGGVRISPDDVGNYSPEQISELARFVEQVSPGAFQQVAMLATDNPLSMTAISMSAALLLLRLLRGRLAKDSQGRP